MMFSTISCSILGATGARVSSASEDRLLQHRAEFPSLTRGVHLISHAVGAMPRSVHGDLARFADAWQDDPYHALERSWLPANRALAAAIARVLGVGADTVIVLPSCSSALAVVASAVRYDGARRRIVYDDQNFTTVHYVWKQQERHGAEVVVVRSRDAQVPIDALLEAIDARTLFVAISHVQFRTGAAYDVPRVVERAHAVGAMVFLDCYQSAGIVPLDLAAWGVDLACGGSIKWACGGPGAAYLYVRPDLVARFEPSATGWLAHADPFAFEMGDMRFPDTIERFGGGMPSFVPSFSARAGWEVIGALGVDSIRRKSLRQTSLVRELARKRGFTVNTPVDDSLRGGTVAVDFAGAAEVSKALQDRQILVDYRPGGGLRVSPHFYNTDDEIHALMDAIDRIRRTAT
jgi:kynureninase